MEITKENLVWFKNENPNEPFLILEDEGGGVVTLGLRDFPDIEQDSNTFKSELNFYTDENFKVGFDIMNKKVNYFTDDLVTAIKDNDLLSYKDDDNDYVELFYGDKSKGFVYVYIDSEDKREYICINDTIYYLETIKKI